MNQEEHVEAGSIAKLDSILRARRPQRVFLCTGKNSFERSGAKRAIEPMFSGMSVTTFADFGTNPSIEDIERGLQIYRSASPDVVVAVGGGSVIDMAKAINVLAANKGSSRSYVMGQQSVSQKGRPLVAIPTTAGTGSEATHFSVVYMEKKKYSLAYRDMLPDYAIIDSDLLRGIPQALAASTGMDAFSQAIEAYWSLRSTDESKAYAREAITLLFPNLVNAVNSPDDGARGAMARGAHLAGKSINIAKTTASHAMSYPLTAHFGIPHGQAVGLTLSSLFEFNSEVSEHTVSDARGAAYVSGVIHEIMDMLHVASGDEARIVIDALMKDIGLSIKLREKGVKVGDIDLLLEEISEERAGNNPRRFTKDDARRMLENII